MTGQPARRPALVGWEITNQCNLTCKHCFTAAGKRAHGELTTGECRDLIDTMAVSGVETIGWTGGEPLLRDDLEELIGYARDRNIRSTITTNGLLLDRSRAHSLMAAGNRAIQISIDGSTAERNRAMRGTTNDEYKKVLDAIRICRDLGCRPILATVVGQENLEDAPEMIKLAIREGAEAIRFCCYAPIGRGRRQDVRKRFSFAEALPELLDFVEQAQAESELTTEFDVGFGPTPPDYTFHECVAGAETLYLKANGDVYPCTALIFPQFNAGNVRRTPLSEIWDSPAMSTAAEYQQCDIQGHCRECDNLANCHGGCRGAVLAHTGDLGASFPHCLCKTAAEALAGASNSNPQPVLPRRS